MVALGLFARDYTLFGSAPMLAHGLLPNIGDIDIVARGSAQVKVYTLGHPQPRHHHLPGALEIFNGWKRRDRVRPIDGTEILHSLPFIHLDKVLTFKRELGRSKDEAHIACWKDTSAVDTCSSPC